MNSTYPHLLTFDFDGQQIEFDLSGAEVMINATEMGRIFGKRPVDFLRLEQTERFIAASKSVFPAFESEAGSLSNAGNAVSTPEKEGRSEAATLSNLYIESEMVRTQRGYDDQGATWMHRLLALKFAAWLDARFEVWVYRTIEQVLFTHGQRMGEEVREKARLLDRRDEIRQELLGNALFQEHQAIECKLRQVGSRMARHTTSQLQLFRQSL